MGTLKKYGTLTNKPFIKSNSYMFLMTAVKMKKPMK